MTLCDIVGRLFQGVCKKGAVHHGLFLLGPPAANMLFPFISILKLLRLRHWLPCPLLCSYGALSCHGGTKYLISVF